MHKDHLKIHPPPIPLVKPAFSKNNVPVVFASNKKYLPYLAVALHSLIKNSSEKNNYDICILCEAGNDLSADFPLEFFKRQNVSVRFISCDVAGRVDFSEHLVRHFSPEAYFRFFIPEIFTAYQKVIYLDVDIIVLNDIAELFKVKLNKKVLAAVNTLTKIYNEKEYYTKELGLKNAENYFCSGVMIFNIPVLQKDNFTAKCLEKLQEIGKPKAVDQDVLNALYEGKVLFLPTEWNVFWTLFSEKMVALLRIKEKYPKEYENYLHNFKAAKIIHFLGDKPWVYVNEKLSWLWWVYARETPYYEQILYRNILSVERMSKQTYRQMERVMMEGSWRWLLLKNIFLSKVVLGKRRRHYHENVWWLRKYRSEFG
ncbi:MAG: glycosyltransferase family 8 protein [Lactobacillales bacterium]|jgi:lipopolysaccharide biosynthesis glycosyltransferase|nr:glycosyltransferase family 8 protein [Lactobacillales bacterium]